MLLSVKVDTAWSKMWIDAYGRLEMWQAFPPKSFPPPTQTNDVNSVAFSNLRLQHCTQVAAIRDHKIEFHQRSAFWKISVKPLQMLNANKYLFHSDGGGSENSFIVANERKYWCGLLTYLVRAAISDVSEAHLMQLCQQAVLLLLSKCLHCCWCFCHLCRHCAQPLLFSPPCLPRCHGRPSRPIPNSLDVGRLPSCSVISDCLTNTIN